MLQFRTTTHGGIGAIALAGLCCGFPAAAQVVADGGLAELSLEQLGELPVTSVTGRPESLRSAPGSVFVISGEDIRRSAATTLPEALRLAPNLQVARLNSGQYAISARGFNNTIANKLLVLIDGRTIYSTLFAGVFWDEHDVVLEDIERIEVISGPGGTLWGANAVNGIINVITKPAAATQGTLLSAVRSSRGGTESARWGGRLGGADVRLYALGTDRASTRDVNGVERADALAKKQVGFRADRALGASQLTLQGDLFRGGDDPANILAPKMHGGNLLGRWESRFADDTPYRVQAYYDLQARDETATFRNEAESFDVQFTHETKLADPAQQVLWGAGYRSGRDSNEPTAFIRFIPEERQLSWANVFTQHQLRHGAWQLTSGLKAERNSYTGVEWLPSLRLAYQHAGASTTWAALSRTVRAPARIDREFFFPGNPPYFIAGGAGFQSEVANVLELGHRGSAGRDLTYSATVFHQQYRGLRAGTGTPAVVSNRIDGHSQGIEAWAQWQPRELARYTLGYLGQRKRLAFADGSSDSTSIPNLGNDPSHQWKLRAQFDLPARTELDFNLRRIGALPSPAVPGYTALDARLGWQATRALEVSLIVKNLLDRRHVEFNSADASVFGRRVFLRLVVQL
jgi:iron complex outermembrane receptor protein